MARLATHVHVTRPDTAERHVFTPDTDEFPDWAVPLITNPAAWEDGVLPDVPSSGRPPRKGKGSSLEAQLAYAETQGVQVPEGASFDEVLALLDAAEQ